MVWRASSPGVSLELSAGQGPHREREPAHAPHRHGCRRPARRDPEGRHASGRGGAHARADGEAKAKGADFIVYPELALTTFFPRWYHEDRAEADFWFEKEMPSAATRPLFERAVKHGMGMSLGYAELTPDGHHFNTSILVDQTGKIVGKYRKVHLPGHAELDKQRAFQHLEKRYFEPGDLGFPVWRFMGGIFGMCICNDRRWPEVYRVMGLQGVEMVTLGFNTPSVNSQKSEEGPAAAHLPPQAVAAGRRLPELDLGGGGGQGRRRGRARAVRLERDRQPGRRDRRRDAHGG